VPQRHDVHRSGGHLTRLLGRGKALAVPALVVGAVFLAGPDNATIFGNNVERVPDGADQVQVSRLFGNLTVIVPNDRQVDPSNIALFGNVECEQACSNDGEVLDVRTFGAFGNVEILTQRERDARLAEEDRRQELENQREEREEREED
jgi:hypothetical protein